MPYESFDQAPKEIKDYLTERETSDLKLRIKEGLNALEKIPNGGDQKAHYVRKNLVILFRMINQDSFRKNASPHNLLLDSIGNSSVILDGCVKRIEKKVAEGKNSQKDLLRLNEAIDTEINNIYNYLKELEAVSNILGQEVSESWQAKDKDDRRRKAKTGRAA